jgi:hypothetical protein
LDARQKRDGVLGRDQCAGGSTADSNSHAMANGRWTPMLHFYVPHNQIMYGWLTEGVLTYSQREPTEVVSATLSHDYTLVKYINTNDRSTQHNTDNETYRKIELLLNMPSIERGDMSSFRTAMNSIPEGSVSEYERKLIVDYILNGIWHNTSQLRDVITIRNRFFGDRFSEDRFFGNRFFGNRSFSSTVKLSKILELLDKGGFRYPNVHCYFCRNLVDRREQKDFPDLEAVGVLGMANDWSIWPSPEDRTELEGWVAGRNTPQKLVWRSRIVLMWASGAGLTEIVRATGRPRTPAVITATNLSGEV